MKRFRFSTLLRILIVCVLLVSCASPLFAQDMASRRTPVVQAVEQVGPTVVNINTEEAAPARRNPFRDFRNPLFDQFFKDFLPRVGPKRRSLGSGVIIHPEGYILTNEHVVAKAVRIKVTLIDKREFDAQLVGADIKSDLAIIKINTSEPLPHVKMGRSDDLLIGETVIAIGNPFGLQHTVTTGVISALNRNIKEGKNRVYRNFIQLDASINPGNSGGPLLNINGSLIGINTAIFQRAEGIGFAIPINRSKRIVDDLIRYGEVRRGWVGVSVQDMTQEMLRFFHLDHVRGVVVVQVMKRSPGALAGLKTGDVILSLDKHEVNDKLDYGDRVSTYPVGNVIGFTVLRDGKEHSVSVKVVVLPREQVVEFARNWLGLDVSGLQSAVARSLGFTSRDGVVVTGVVPNSAGGKIGIKPGDVIRQVNQTQINTEEDFKTAMVEAAGRDNILFLIQRGRNGYYVTLEP